VTNLTWCSDRARALNNGKLAYNHAFYRPICGSKAAEENMRHAILGAGGVGGLIGAALAKSGDAVTLVLRPEAIKDYPAELLLESSFGSFFVPVGRAAGGTPP